LIFLILQNIPSLPFSTDQTQLPVLEIEFDRLRTAMKEYFEE